MDQSLALPKADVLIIGGGIVGLTAAHELTQKNVNVAVVEKGEIGYGCSYGNAGWLTPCFAMPLPMPGMLAKSIKWLFDPESPLYIKPDLLNPLLVQWLARFMRAMTRAQMQRSVQTLTDISKYSLDAYAKLNQQYPGSFGFTQKGLLMVSNTKEGLKSAVDEMDLVSKYEIPGKMLGADEIKKLEPSIRGHILGGVYFPKEAHAEPLRLTQTLAKVVSEKGGSIYPNTEVFRFETSKKGEVLGVHTSRGLLKADRYVLATGSWSTEMGKALKLNVPILGGKGYSMITRSIPNPPQIPIMYVEKKIAITPRPDGVRIAGTLELVDQDFSITERRVNAIKKGASELFDLETQPQVSDVWRGLRPCTPDGVPIVGRPKRYQNLFLCAGHQMLGIQSAPGTGRLVADLITDSAPTFDPAPYDPNRF